MEYLDDEEKAYELFREVFSKSAAEFAKKMDSFTKELEKIRLSFLNSLPQDHRNKLIIKERIVNQDICKN